MTWNQSVFEIMYVFLTKCGHKGSVFLEKESFLKKYGHESIDFFVKNRKKRASYWHFFLPRNIVCFWQNWRFCDQISLKNKLLSYSHILKNVHSPKNTVILCHFIQIFHAKPSTGMPIFVQKLQFCQNYTTLWLRKKIDFRGSGRGGGLEHLWQLLG